MPVKRIKLVKGFNFFVQRGDVPISGARLHNQRCDQKLGHICKAVKEKRATFTAKDATDGTEQKGFSPQRVQRLQSGQTRRQGRGWLVSPGSDYGPAHSSSLAEKSAHRLNGPPWFPNQSQPSADALYKVEPAIQSRLSALRALGIRMGDQS